MPEKVSLRNLVALILFLVGYYLLGYYIPRHDTILLFVVLGFTFFIYIWVISKVEPKDFKFWIAGAILLRLIFLISTPQLSDDVYRFIWDGRMLANGLNPFEFLPFQVLEKYPGLNGELFDLLNSQQRPTIYPPVSQWIFWVSAIVSPESIQGSIVFIRSSLIIIEFGTIYLMLHLMRRLSLKRTSVLIYALNPLVILEISGNLHFEGMMLFFLLLSIALIYHQKKNLSAIAWGLAVGVKLIPLIFLPLFIRRFKPRSFIFFGLIVGLVSVVIFLPLLSIPFLNGMTDAITLYFQKFEFNASIYYLVRELGFYFKGWNMIATIGPQLAITTFLVILGYSWYESKRPVRIFEAMIWVLFIYFSLALIVHPWYIISLVGFTIFTKWKWPIAWSGLIFLSYEGYTADGYIENYALIAVEYIALIGFIIFDLRQLKKAQAVQ